ncbi:two-component system sensor histidine kinase CreC [Aquabacterium sp.]|uniref:two-component system sensor histidine kinase CreC n=1 Tax=Aquabacterium sp. TaxID=1872578 RepID=UPI002D0EE016|nr:two-component system sensor histidine kinase CreC [Aquabacterium sp.]HSW07554.1 two-component system sensor histidine kinase CreC [Aquabacterium sp.]
MHLGLRLLFGFFLIAGLASFFVLRVFLAEVKPAVREVTEDVLVDAAHLLAEQATAELAALPAGGTMQQGGFADAVRRYRARPIDAQIWGLHKRSLDFRLYLTDAAGRVVFEDGPGDTVGTDYSRWRDVARTLRGDYGARSTRDVADDERSTVLYVAAPVLQQGRTIGVLTVAKPVQTLQQFIDRAERKILVAGAWLLGLSLAVGVGVTLWTVGSVRRLRRYAQQARAGDEPQPVPALPGELGELARAMAAMRERLEDRSHVEQSMRALTHELKSPLTAIGGAAELLHDELPAADREAFARQIGEQVQRLRQLVEQLLELSKLESLRPPEPLPAISPLAVFDELLRAWTAPLRQRDLAVQWGTRDAALVPGDAERLRLALSNLLANALDFAPAGSALELAVKAERGTLHISLRDRGPGVPDFALPQLGQRFFSTPRPADGRKGSGLGLAIVRQVALLHHGQLLFAPANPGLRVTLVLPR